MSIEFDELHVADEGSDCGPERRRIVAGVAAAVLVAAVGGVGYGIGRGVDHDTSAVDVDGSGAADVDREDAAAAVPSTISATVEERSAALGPSPSYADVAAGAAVHSEGGDAGVRSSGGPGYPAFGTQPMETLYERTTDSGFAFRVQLGRLWDDGLEGDSGAGGWRPAPWCFETGQMRVAMAGNGIVDVGGVPWYAEPFKGRAVSWLLLGGNDSDPQWVIVTQTTADVTNVRVTFANGSTDATAPQGGIAVLTARGEPSTPVAEGDSTYWMDPTPSFEATFEGGAEPVRISLNEAGRWEDSEFRASCTPPPPSALPDTSAQPAHAGTPGRQRATRRSASRRARDPVDDVRTGRRSVVPVGPAGSRSTRPATHAAAATFA